jgi:hypothetical protein
MSTIGLTNWAVDLANVGAIYPFQGAEIAMALIGLVFWIGWHVLQIRQETEEFDSAAQRSKSVDVRATIDRY